LLDLNIELIASKIHTSAFQKSLNLYHYLPPRFAHPPSCLKGRRAGEMRRYFIQSSQEGFESILEKFIIRLMERSNQLKNIIPILQQKAVQLNNVHAQQTSQTNSNTLYIYQIYHPYGIQRNDIRKLFNKILEPILDFDRMTVAMSRPRNLRDTLT